MIEFFCENVPLPDLDYPTLEKWIVNVAATHYFEVGNLTYCFCDDEYILDTNRKFLNHDYYTDIITFDYTRLYGASGRYIRAERGEAGSAPQMRGKIGGDMVISLDTVRTNAEGLNVPYIKELLRVIIHGVLHLCGIDDKGPGEREIMEAHENEALALLYKN